MSLFRKLFNYKIRVLGYIASERSITLRAIQFVAIIWLVAATTGCAVTDSTFVPPSGGPPQVPHSMEGREGQCLSCHKEGVAGAPKVSIDHLSKEDGSGLPFPTQRTNDMCTLCHIQATAPGGLPENVSSGTPATAPPHVPHSMEGREGQCLLCHEEGIAGASMVPVDHAGRTSDICTTCHQPAAAGK